MLDIAASLTDNVLTKRCSKCGEEWPLTMFHAKKRAVDGRMSHCKKCNCEKSRQYTKNNPGRRKAARKAYYDANREKLNKANRQRYWANSEEIKALAKQKRTGKQGCLRTMLGSAKARSKEKGWDCDLDIDYLVSIAPDYCPVDNKPFDWNRKRESLTDGESFDYSIPSIDRTDSAKGYIKGNVAIIGDQWNRWKNNMQLDDLIVLTKYVRSVTKK
jgi:predicted  nucleic acid-binding Zn-ribbon protein